MDNQLAPASYLKAFNILFFALLAGQTIFAVIAFALRYSGLFTNSNETLEQIFMYIVPAVYVIAVVSGTAIFRKRLPEIKANVVFNEKLNAYRAVYILRFALVEGATLIAIITYLITGRQMFILLAMLSIFSFFVLKPSKNKLTNELELSSEETELISD